MGFIDAFGRGFKKGWNGVFSVAEKVPFVGEVAAEMKLHKGGKVPKTGNFRLKGGEVVLNKTQLAQLKKRKTAKGKQKVINDVSKRRPKKMKGQKVKGRKVKGRGRK